MMMTPFWSDESVSLLTPVKTSLITLLFILGVAIFALREKQRFEGVLHKSAWVASVAAACSLLYYNYMLFFHNGPDRLPGYFLLDNPLITTHVYGAFAIYWLVRAFLDETSRKLSIICMVVIGILLIQTGSRTPFIAIGLALLWLFLAQNKRKGFMIGLSVIVLCVLAQYVIAIAFDRWAGYSYRPEIWAKTIGQILEAPWFGHGYKAPLVIHGAEYEWYSNPHNIELAVLYDGGLVGLLLWACVYFSALRFSWRFRKDRLTLLASTWLIYGMGAGLTEGRSYMSLPKEHWFLIWIPLSLLFASSILQCKRGEADKVSEKQ